MYNPFEGQPITSDWADHKKRGRGGIDYGLKNGTALPAVASGKVTRLPLWGAAGNTVKLATDKGDVYYMHLSKFGKTGQVNQGDIIGYSGGLRGAVGSGSSTGAHLHIHAIVGGKYVDFRSLVDGSGGNAQTIGLDLGDPLGTKALADQVGGIASWVSYGPNWVRVGIFVLGATLLGLALTKILAASPAGEAVIDTAKTAIGVAAKVKTGKIS